MSVDWETLALTAEQIAELKASAISPRVAALQGLYSVSDAKDASKLFGRTAKQWADHLPVLVFPYMIPFQRDPVLVRGKPARPFEAKQNDGSTKAAKYVQAKDSGTHIMLGPSLVQGTAAQDVSIPLIITEGEKKMLAAESAGFSAIALPGVHQWHLKGEKRLHLYFVHLALVGRVILLCFDADSLKNKDVRKQELEFGRALEAAGAKVYIVRFPPEAGKLDDFLATHEVTELHQLFADAKERGALPPDTSAAGASDEVWKDVFKKLRIDDDKGTPIKDVDNITRVLMFHPTWQGVLAFDARQERQTFARQPPFADDLAVERASVPRPLIDSDVTRIGAWLVAQACLGWQLQPQPSQIERAIAAACERNRVDAVKSYLLGLTWDKTPRLDTMGPTYFGTDDNAYTRTVFAKWMLSAVARVRQPGCQVDHVLVLEGEQGIGKSTALKRLAGSDENFSDSLPDISTKDALEHCVGPWIIELAELDHMRRSEVNTLKAFISMKAPRFRHAYGHRTTEHPRRCVFAATTNEGGSGGYLTDPTGGRRFWPVACRKADSDGLAKDRDQLWAEALHRVRAGEAWHITDPGVHAEAREEQAARRQVDPWLELIAPFLRGRKIVTIGEVLDHLGFGPDENVPSGFGSYQRAPVKKGWKYDQRSSNRAAAIMRELGWTRRQLRVDGERVWKYVREEASTSGGPVTGDTVETGKTLDFIGKSPPSPVSPLDPYSNVYARAPDAGTDPSGVDPSLSTDPNSIRSKIYTGDSSDSGDLEANPNSSSVTGKSPPPEASGDTAAPRPRKRL
jgi:predicted P-loop ATPase